MRETQFERYVNSKDNQTTQDGISVTLEFERYVNSKDNQTGVPRWHLIPCLRDM